MCDVIGCDSKSEYYDDMDNQICESCMMQDMDENNKIPDDYEQLRS